jgi:AraC-like DNA-binding protein
LLRQRSVEARREKARRGELVVGAPVGYFNGDTGMEKDPDRRVQEIIVLVFSKVQALGTVRQALLAQKAPQEDFYGLSIPLNVPFTVSELGYDQTFVCANAHMLSPGSPFTFQCKRKCHSMVCNIYVDSLNAYRARMLQEPTTGQSILKPRVSLLTAAGSGLFRSAARAWVALGMDDSSVSEIARQEIEDDLLTCFLSLAEDPQTIDREALSPSDFGLKRTEDYICANLDRAITRDELADTAGVSIRSLNRAFEKRYGSGPMAFVRQRRLDACYTRLLGSDPRATTVTDVATSYGFSHFGKFAMAYKKAFGESPSASLLK